MSKLGEFTHPFYHERVLLMFSNFMRITIAILGCGVVFKLESSQNFGVHSFAWVDTKYYKQTSTSNQARLRAELKHITKPSEKKTTVIPLVTASEAGEAQT